MKLISILLIQILFLTAHAATQPQVIIIQGGGVEREFVHDLKRSYNSLLSWGILPENIQILSDAVAVGKAPLDLNGDGNYDAFVDYKEENLQRAIKKAVKKLNGTGQLLILSMSHGDDSPKPLLDIADDYNVPSLFADHLKQILDQEVPYTVELAMVIDACYSYGMAEVAAGPNRYFFTSAPAHEKSPSNKISGGYFLNQFLDYLDENVNKSFMDAYQYSLERRGLLRFSNLPYAPQYNVPTGKNFILTH